MNAPEEAPPLTGFNPFPSKAVENANKKAKKEL